MRVGKLVLAKKLEHKIKRIPILNVTHTQYKQHAVQRGILKYTLKILIEKARETEIRKAVNLLKQSENYVDRSKKCLSSKEINDFSKMLKNPSHANIEKLPLKQVYKDRLLSLSSENIEAFVDLFLNHHKLLEISQSSVSPITKKVLGDELLNNHNNLNSLKKLKCDEQTYFLLQATLIGKNVLLTAEAALAYAQYKMSKKESKSVKTISKDYNLASQSLRETHARLITLYCSTSERKTPFNILEI